MDRIGDMSLAELRRFIVNNVLTDPGALPATLATSTTVAAALAAMLPDLPVGSMTDYAGAGDPSDARWLLCDGRAVKRGEYGTLFSLIGVTFGAGDGSTTFNLPDLRGRVTAGPDNMGTAAGAASRLAASNTLGAAAGEENHTLTTAEMPVHNHGITDTGHNHTQHTAVDVGSGTAIAVAGNNASVLSVSVTANASTGITINNAGSGTAHNVKQPYQIVNKIIKVR